MRGITRNQHFRLQLPSAGLLVGRNSVRDPGYTCPGAGRIACLASINYHPVIYFSWKKSCELFILRNSKYVFEKYRQNAPARYGTTAKVLQLPRMCSKTCWRVCRYLGKTTEGVTLSGTLSGLLRDPAKCVSAGLQSDKPPELLA